ncbi:extracellular solute-binding protein [Paenibacillus sp. 3LSP]|uniref:ABC transporter substrate-binding protein n=1 Tax=Paenibacillus sp. 3LSP TaxID=2800795 RepID=UPI0028FD4215|nr:extracellular solute-binding protein [Paenibacillus sp. 3LSP]MDU0332305.1 extracellular solute-binding protein [Paenibacillus sp. 3LSP]
MKNRRLRKSWVTLLVLAMMITAILAGCAKNDSAANRNTSEPSSNSGGTSANAEGEAPTLGGIPTSIEGEIVVWDWDEAFLTTMVPEFNKVFPNVKVKYTVVNNNDYMQKLQSGIASGSEVPDVILGEMNFRGQLFDLDVLDNLEQAPYHFSKDQLLDYLPPLLSNTKGELVGVDQSITPAGLGYRRDLAKEYLGTDDPNELSTLLPDWNAFIQKGIEVKEKSGGAVTMIASFDDAYRVLKGQTEQPYINGSTIELTERMKVPFEKLFAMRDAGILGKYEGYTPGWNASFAKGDNIFYPMAPWSPKWNVQANDPDGIGRWGLMAAPEGGFTYGGTSVSVYKNSKNKEAAWSSAVALLVFASVRAFVLGVSVLSGHLFVFPQFSRVEWCQRETVCWVRQLCDAVYKRSVVLQIDFQHGCHYADVVTDLGLNRHAVGLSHF